MQPSSFATAGESLTPLFEPKIVAVVGASATSVTFANEFIRQSRRLNFAGRIVPIHPTAKEIEGLPCARSIAEIGAIVDYAYIAIAAERVPDLLADAAGKLRFAQVISSGFGEVEGGQALEKRLLEVAKASGIRVLGPNCLGLHSPRAGLTFLGQALGEFGRVGIVSQSGGLAVDMILRGQERGLRFSGIVTIGNTVDLGPSELLEFYLADNGTDVVGLYLEDVRDGRRFFETLRKARAAKPVVLLIGGQTQQGQRAATSHTGSLATDFAVWSGLSRQTGAVITATLNEFLDALLAFQTLKVGADSATPRVVLFGNGGGTSVLAADAFARAGLDVSPMPAAAQAALAALKLPPGTSIVNPIDTPAATLRQEDGRVAERILDAVFTLAKPHALVMHINLPVFMTASDRSHDVVGNLVDAALRVQARQTQAAHFIMVLRSDGAAATDERKRAYRADALKRGIPVYDEMTEAAAALAAVAQLQRYRAKRKLER
jgi:acyl-CoA synthetase (NDP forming)